MSKKTCPLRLSLELDSTRTSSPFARVTKLYVVARATGLNDVVPRTAPTVFKTESASLDALVQDSNGSLSFAVLGRFEMCKGIDFSVMGVEGGINLSGGTTSDVEIATGSLDWNVLKLNERSLIQLDAKDSFLAALGKLILLVEPVEETTLAKLSSVCSSSFSFRNECHAEFMVQKARSAESAYETLLSYSIPLSLTQEVYLGKVQTRLERWQNFAHLVKTAQCSFDSETQAAQQGHTYVEIRVVAAEALCQTQHTFDSSLLQSNTTKPNLGNRLATGMNNLLSSASAKVSQRLNAVQVQAGQSDGRRLCNSYVVVSYLHPGSNQRIVVGRTNTEYRSKDAIYGSNRNKGLCDHSKCQTEHVPYGSTKLLQDNYFGFYVPALESLSITFELFHERFSLTRGITAIPMMSRSITLAQLLKGSLPNVSLDLFHNTRAATEVVSAGSESGRCASPLQGAPEGQLAAGTLVISFRSKREGHSLPDLNRVVLLQNRLLYFWDTAWILSYIEQLEQILAEMKASILLCEACVGCTSCFKPSTSKKDAKAVTIPTNLHVAFFGVDQGRSGIHGFATAGIPADHTDLSSKNSLSELREQLRIPLGIQWSPLYPDIIDQGMIAALGPGEASSLLNRLKCRALLDQRLLAREWRVTAQALAIVIASVTAKICVEHALGRLEWWVQTVECIGVLVVWESLVSSQGKELAMTLDAIGAMEILNEHLKVQLRFCTGPGSTVPNVRVVGEHIVEIAINLEAEANCAKLVEKEVTIPVRVAMFTQGINEVQSVANATNRVSANSGSAVQSQVNRQGLETVSKYWHQAKTFLPLNVTLLEDLMSSVVAEKSSAKDVGILLCASDVGRNLNACRITCCKSGKDRTAMSVTLECARILLSRDAAEESLLACANLFREFGVRLTIAEKNVGRPLYSFNAIQRKLLPRLYRPPVGTIQDLYLSVTARDS